MPRSFHLQGRGGLAHRARDGLELQGLSSPGSAPDAVASAVALAGIAAFAVASLATLSGLLAAEYSSSDVAMAPYVTELWLRAPPGSQLLMGHAPFYTGLWIFRLLHLLPDHRLTWELAPWVLSVAASLAVARAVFLAVGRAAALLVAAALICAGTYLLGLQLAWGVHGLAYVNVMLLGAFLAWLSHEAPTSRGRLSRERAHPLLLWPSTVALAAVTAAGVATDKIVIVAGLVPFAVVGIPLARRAHRAGSTQLAGAVTTVILGSVAGAFVVRAAMTGERLHATAFPIHAAPLGSIPSHLLLLVQSVYSLLGGYLHESDSTSVTPRGALGYLCAAAATFLIALAVAEAAALPRRLGGAARSASAAFWSVNAVIVSVVYVATTLPDTISTRRYLVTVAYAVVVLGVSRGATAARRTRALTVASVATLLVASISGLLEHDLSKVQATSPTPAMARDIDRLAAREHVRVVYGGYWDSYAIGWLGGGSIPIEPVFTYGHRLVAGVGSGAGFGGIVRPGATAPAGRSLLILDGTLDPVDGMSGAALGSLGTPVATVRLDRGRLHAYLYGYDIATRFYRVANSGWQ